jgi:hypothetical protein
VTDDHDPEKHFDPEKLRLELGQFVNDVWDAAIGGAPEEKKVTLRGAAYGVAARFFIAGRLSERPALGVMERRIGECMARGDDVRTMAGVLLSLYEDPDGRPLRTGES